MKNISKILTFLLLFSIFSTVIYGAPSISSISGTPVDNSNITISGLSFGTGPSEVEFLGGASGNIESGTTGSNFSCTDWNIDGDFNIPIYSTSQKHSGSKSLYCNPTSENWNSILTYHLPTAITSSSRIFISAWYRWNYTGEGQWKMLRLETSNTVVDGSNELVFFDYPGELQVCVDPDTVGYTGMYNVVPHDTLNSWFRMDFIVTGGVSSGIVTVAKYIPDVSRATSTLNPYPTHRSGSAWNYAVFQNYAGTGGGYSGITAANIYIDDIYVSSGSFARVEIGNASTYSSCSHLEIQPPSSWSSTSITVKVNRGSFGTSDSAYLFIIDSDGNPSTGYPITFGGGSSAPVANFSGTPTSGTIPLSVSFTDLSTNSPTSWSWNFGDSSTSTSQNPTHSYTSAGTYTVSLTATNAYGSDSETKTSYITASSGSAPVAAFSGTPTSGTIPFTVAFTDSSTNSPTSWSWNFGDSSTSTSQNPSHQYTVAGIYNVALTATNSYGSDTETKTSYITASSGSGEISKVGPVSGPGKISGRLASLLRKVGGRTYSGGGTSCTESSSMKQTNTEYSVEMSQIVSQRVYNSSSLTVCGISLYLDPASTSSTYTVEIRSAINGGGTLYGSSKTITPSSTSGGWYDFTWSSNYPNPTGNYYICVSSSNSSNLLYYADENYEGTSYSAYAGNTQYTQYDLSFKVKTQ